MLILQQLVFANALQKIISSVVLNNDFCTKNFRTLHQKRHDSKKNKKLFRLIEPINNQSLKTKHKNVINNQNMLLVCPNVHHHYNTHSIESK